MASRRQHRGNRIASFLLALQLANVLLAQVHGAQHHGIHAEGEITCEVGCKKLYRPVCGKDGHTYGNKCIAKCQGVELQHEGACADESLLHPENIEIIVEDNESHVQVTDMHAFKSEGFNYMGQMRFTNKGFARPTQKNHPHKHIYTGKDGDYVQQGSEKQALKALRITREGHVYAGDINAAAEAALSYLRAQGGVNSSDSHSGSGSDGGHHHNHHRQSKHMEPVQNEGYAPATDEEVLVAGPGGDANNQEGYAEQFLGNTGRRVLGVFGSDDRIDCPRTPTYPFTAIGQINIKDKTGNYVCSGALVGPDVVLTAAHCVFSRTSQGFYDSLDYAPSRYLRPDGTIVNPFGVVPWSYVTIYQGYSAVITPDPNVWDMAVIKLSAPIGLTAGWLGVYEPCGEYAPTRYVANTAGYPSDMPSGSCKFTQCAVSQSPCTDSYLYHKCDTASGQSGSPMWMLAMTSARKMGPYIRAVHNIEWVQSNTGGSSESYINSAVSITPDHYRSVLAWISPSFTANPSAASRSAPMAPARPAQ